MYKNIFTQSLRNPLFQFGNSEADVLRLDVMHPVISGNKWFKLKHHLRAAKEEHKKGLVSFGGAYSNHLVAMAHACQNEGLVSTGIIRGEDPKKNNPSIRQMKDAGMDVRFVSRDAYRNKEALLDQFLHEHQDYYYVPEGGRSKEGINGAAEILDHAQKNYTHIICAVGTGTTLAGIIHASNADQKVVGISSLKVANEHNNELLTFLHDTTTKNNYEVNFNYHFGGYAKKNEELIRFMNDFYKLENIPTDFVYTGKLFYAVHDLAGKNYFAPGSRILIIHTGGLQGNRSLPRGTLVF